MLYVPAEMMVTIEPSTVAPSPSTVIESPSSFIVDVSGLLALEFRSS
jgi:hypothetical protein